MAIGIASLKAAADIERHQSVAFALSLIEVFGVMIGTAVGLLLKRPWLFGAVGAVAAVPMMLLAFYLTR